MYAYMPRKRHEKSKIQKKKRKEHKQTEIEADTVPRVIFAIFQDSMRDVGDVFLCKVPTIHTATFILYKNISVYPTPRESASRRHSLSRPWACLPK